MNGGHKLAFAFGAALLGFPLIYAVVNGLVILQVLTLGLILCLMFMAL